MRFNLMSSFIVRDLTENQRLDQYLAAATGLSRAKIQKRVKDGPATINGKPATPHALVRNGDVIDLPEAAAEPTPEKAPPLDIVYQDKDVLVVNKPAGLIVHKASKDDMGPTLSGSVVKKFKTVAKVGDAERPGIVHRLDKLASGLLVVARTAKAYDMLVDQFKGHRVEKEYLALVYGKLAKDADTIRFRIDRSREKKRMIALPEDSDEGNEAETSYEVVQRYATVTLVRVRIKTGRTHQIRTHFHAIDHPLVGDPLYQKRHMPHTRPVELDRLFLHAVKLGIDLPSGEHRVFSSELPPELEHVLEGLQKISP